MACKNEIGNKYGILTVLERAENDKHGKARWVCECECGKKIIVHGTALRSGNTKSCGCRRLSAELQEIGKRYGLLTVESVAGRTSAKKIVWHCRCDCGMYTDVPTGHLHSGAIKTCGNHSGGKNLIDETGKRYGLLKVLEKAPSPKSSNETGAFWKCRCDCGNEIIVSGSNLRTKNSQSCGCVKSLGEYTIIRILKENHINFKTQYIFEDLKYKQYLKYDFAILDASDKVIRLIEFDGPQHNKNSQWYTEEGQLRDLMKNQYAFSNNIPLIRIPYKERDNLTYELLFSDKYLLDMRDMLEN